MLLNKRKYNVGLVKFRRVSTTYQKALLNKVKNIKPIHKLVKNQIKVNSTLCEINTISRNYEDAFKESVSEIDTSINVLKLFRNSNDNSQRKYFGQIGEVISGDSRVIIVEQLTGRYTFNLRVENVGFLIPFILDAGRINNMNNNGFNLIHSMLKGNRNKIEQSIISAINWYGKSYNSYSSEKKLTHPNIFFEPERFLYCFTALESLLIPDRVPISPNLARRIAHICELKYKNKKVTSTNVKKLYRIRCNIVHDGVKFIQKQDFELLSNITKTAIISLIQRRKRLNINTTEDLIDWFVDKDLA